MEVGLNGDRDRDRDRAVPVAVDSLNKRFGTVTALDRVSLEFKAGEVTRCSARTALAELAPGRVAVAIGAGFTGRRGSASARCG